jgi:hypothetical protein
MKRSFQGMEASWLQAVCVPLPKKRIPKMWRSKNCQRLFPLGNSTVLQKKSSPIIVTKGPIVERNCKPLRLGKETGNLDRLQRRTLLKIWS